MRCFWLRSTSWCVVDSIAEQFFTETASRGKPSAWFNEIGHNAALLGSAVVHQVIGLKSQQRATELVLHWYAQKHVLFVSLLHSPSNIRARYIWRSRKTLSLRATRPCATLSAPDSATITSLKEKVVILMTTSFPFRAGRRSSRDIWSDWEAAPLS
jgi:hypothetical protein